MRIRRCSTLLIEPRERFEFDFDSLLEGGDGMTVDRRWVALAPHLGGELTLTSEELAPLGSIAVADLLEFDDACKRFEPALLRSLLDKGLLIADTPEHAGIRARDEALRATRWHAHSAVAHAFGRWQGVDSGVLVKSEGTARVSDLVAKLGDPPPHFHARGEPSTRIALAKPPASGVDALLRRRTVCRNYDLTRKLPFSTFSHLMQRVFGALAVHTVTPGAAIVKKTSPSAGGLHPTEAYLLLQGVEGVATGLYHYHVGDHALEPM